MKLLIVTRRQLLIASCLLTAVMMGFAGTMSLMGAASKRRLPIYCVENHQKQVALTFDAAWGDSDTDELIEILGRHGAKATFFVVGEWADKYPESVKKFADAGHSVMNHSDTHAHMTKLSREETVREITACSEKIERITGVKPDLFRAPYGEYDDETLDTVRRLGMYPIQWDCDSRDWKADYTVDKIVDGVVRHVQPGSIILMHNDAKNTPAALERILAELQGQGYSFVTAGELILRERYVIDNAGRQISTGPGLPQ